MIQLTLVAIRSILLIVLCAVMPYAVMAQQCPTLVWSDEFNQATLNTADWNYDTGGGGYGNNELENYTSRSQNIGLSSGNLVITALKEDYQTEHYTSAKINTYGKQHFTYGRMEARIKLPSTQGLWPAFWMMPEDSYYGSWPQSGEIDIMEEKGSDPTTDYGTIHYGTDAGAGHKYKGGTYSGSVDLSLDFHIYAVEWKPDTISWYIDDVNYYTVTKTDLGTSNWPFDKDFFIILNLAVGGNFGGDPNASTVFPQTMEVDYVRVYNNVNTLHITGTTKAFANQTYTYSVTNGSADSYTWAVPSGATIVSGQGTNTINVQWGTTGGDVSVAVVKNPCAAYTIYKTVSVIPNGCDLYFDDFESNQLLSYSTATTGVAYNGSSSNPLANSVNSSSTVCLYQRNSYEQYDALKYDVNFLPTSTDYENGHDVLFMDMYTAAPVGTIINWQFENKAKASSAYPSGRRAIFQGKTTVQNQWERIKFTLLTRPDLGTDPTTIDQFTILFDPNTYTNDTYYIDNLMRRDVYNCGLVTSVQNAMEQNFIISPNPAQDQLNVSMQSLPSGQMDVSVMDVLGVEHIQQSYTITSSSQQETIDISQLKPGMYIVYAKQGDAMILSRKIIVQ
ncbi:MAG: Glucan endo,3-beta-D-glucosidase [Chitinophagaceae bacterium]|nr:Glucan endo,3-beta-D-glucosidase [Chitinophagaceae bacterium]